MLFLTFVYLVSDVENGDVRVDFDHIFVVRKQVKNVGNGGGHPSASLVEKLIEAFGTS